MRLLNIFISITREHKNIELTLDSIDKVKLAKDLAITIITNDSNVKKDLLRRYNFETKVLQSKKKFGVLYNEALSNCKTEYLTFIDAGDLFDTNGFKQILEILKNEKPNVLRTNLAESYLGLDGRPAVGIVNYTFVETPHAHFFKVDFLREKNIGFKNELDVYSLENFYRNAIYNSEIKSLNITTYLGGFKAVQYDKNHLPLNVENIDEYYDSIIDTFEMLRNNDSHFFESSFFNVLFSMFIIVESPEFSIPTLIDKKRKYEGIIFSLYNDYKEIYEKYDENYKNNILGIEFEKQRRTNINIKLTMYFLDFINKMKAINEEYDNSNNHFLDIIIPEYNGEEYIFSFFDSLTKQKNVNFDEIGIIVVNDASPKKIKSYKFKKYGNLHIEYLLKPTNGGPGMARQYGIENSKAEYVTFFDCDDTFYDDNEALIKMISVLKSGKPKVAIGNVIEEFKNGSVKIHKSGVDNRVPFVHGMYCNREYLLSNNLKFIPELRVCEDTYFYNIVVLSTNYTAVNVNVYYWRYNKESLVRKEEELPFDIRNFEYLLTSGIKIIEFLENVKDSRSDSVLLLSLYGAYFILNSNYFNLIELKEKKEKYEKELLNFFTNNQRKYDELTKDFKKEMFEREFVGLSRGNDWLVVPKISFDDYMLSLEKKYR